MKKTASFFVLIILLITSCSEDEEVKFTNLLTSKTWGKPHIIIMPDNSGYWGGTNCDESYNFFPDKNNFSRKDDCMSFPITGKWTWSKIGTEIFIDYQGNMPYNQKIKILQLSDTLLHTIERHEHEKDDGSNNFWEKKYRPRRD
ncbi:MAG TPA: hypothetical protein VK921_18060 [Anditalea sp.]|nr:hypothetical protein [Anditalea sp.]